MTMLLVRARCECHVWIISSLHRLGRCARCKQRPDVQPGLVNDDPSNVTVCIHEGPCRP